MSFRESARTGNQNPRLLISPSYSLTFGIDAAELSRSYGMTPDPWQQAVLEHWLAVDDDCKYVAITCGLPVPRQNGKNGILEMRELYGMSVVGEKFLHTAHEVKTARKAFLRLCGFFEDAAHYPELAEMVSDIRKTNGQEAIILKNGGSVEFSARSRGAARGWTVDVVVMDEAQELTEEQLQALLATVSASPLGNRQIIYTGTPPAPNSPGDVFQRVRESALNHTDPHLCWMEWSVPDIGDVTDRSRWWETNPGMGIRLDEDFTETELKQMTAEGFARERLGWWAPMETVAHEISAEAWGRCASNKIPAGGKLVYAVKFSVDGARGSISVAIKGRKPGELPYVDCIKSFDMSHGIGWIAEWLEGHQDLASLIVIDGHAYAGSLITELKRLGVRDRMLKLPKSGEVSTAAQMLCNAVKDGAIRVNPKQALTDSALHAVRRNIGSNGDWGLGAEGEWDSTLIESSSLALWGVETTKRDAGRKQQL